MKTKLSLLVLLILLNLPVFSQNYKMSELLIIDKDAMLFKDDSANTGMIRKLEFLEKVYLIKTGERNRVFIETEMNEKGWVDSNKISIIPSNWKRIDGIDELYFFIPSNIKYVFDKGKFAKHRLGKKYVVSREDKLYAKNNFFILINRSDETFDEIFEKEKIKDKVFKRNSVYIEKKFKKNILIFNNDIGMDFIPVYYILLRYKGDSYIRISVSPENSDPSPEEIRKVLKILFSFELKNDE